VLAALAGMAGFGSLAWIAWMYVRKRASEQTLLISKWWFLATVWASIALLPSGFWAAASVWLAYLAFRIVRAVGLQLRPRSRGCRCGCCCCGRSDRGSEVLLRRLSLYWRHVGHGADDCGYGVPAAEE
jgi:hypothetical protein